LCLVGLALPSASLQAQIGEFGADLNVLRRFYTPPRSEQSNHYFDLFGGSKVYETLLNEGLTNNRALIVLSHGKGIVRYSSLRYGYYPDEKVWAETNVPYFSAADLAHVLGDKAAAQIHNIMIAGCNREDAFEARELRRYFVNATNITHSLGGKEGYEMVFRHTLTHASSDIRLLYSSAGNFKLRGVSVAARARKLGFAPYLSELFRHGEQFAYATQIAGRELLEPSILQHAPAEPAEARLAEAATQIVAAARKKNTVVPAGGPARATRPEQAVPPPPSSQSSPGVIRWRNANSEDAPTSTSGVVRWTSALSEP